MLKKYKKFNQLFYVSSLPCMYFCHFNYSIYFYFFSFRLISKKKYSCKNMKMEKYYYITYCKTNKIKLCRDKKHIHKIYFYNT